MWTRAHTHSPLLPVVCLLSDTEASLLAANTDREDAERRRHEATVALLTAGPFIIDDSG